MAVAFTALANWEHAQDTYAAQEIVLAYSERRQAIRQSAVSSLASGDIKQNRTFWRGVQDWCENAANPGGNLANTMYYIDHTITIQGLGSTEFPWYTPSAFRYNSGLTSGFRRATEWPTDWTNYEDSAYSYGKIQRGDIVGPWIFADLQKALGAFRSTGVFGALTSEGEIRTATGTGNSFSAALSSVSSNWSSSSWGGFLFSHPYGARFDIDAVDGGDYSITASRQRRDDTLSNIPDFTAHSARGWINHRPSTALGRVLNDADFAEGFSQVATFESDTTTSRTIPKLSLEGLPEPNTYDIPDAPDINRYESFGRAWYDISWEFTNE